MGTTNVVDKVCENALPVLNFKDFQQAIQRQFATMQGRTLYRVAFDRDALWDAYLSAYPAGTNPIYKERTEHDCSSCRHFVKTMGGVVAIKDGKLQSIWDCQVGGQYQVVADTLSALVKSVAVDNIFLHTERSVGTAKNFQQLLDRVITWEHFHVVLPDACVVKSDDIGTRLSDARSTHDVLARGLAEITADSVDAVLELIAQNSLYRGEEQKFAVEAFQKLQIAYNALPDDGAKEIFVWNSLSTVPPSVSRIRNTSIGTLLVDLSEGKDLEDAVKSFEQKVAPANYKRPTALVTKAMVERARKEIDELGYTSSLERRYATLEDITVADVLFADRSVRKAKGVFDEISSSVAENPKNLDRVEEVPVDRFLSEVLPKATSLEVLFENRHAGNLVSLVAPVDPTAKGMFKWKNNFSWSYAGDLADSIKEKVKKAGGRVDADLRGSLSWFNYDDLDLHMTEPGGEEIYFIHKTSMRTNGQLDVDMNAGGGHTRSAVENIFYPEKGRMMEGMYRLFVNQYRQRESVDVGFEAELEFDGVIHSFAWKKALHTGENVDVVTFHWSRKDGIKFIKSLPSEQASKTVWGVQSQTFRAVDVVMNSPNHWDNAGGIGNRHLFFMLRDCRNEGKARGFFNEFLTEDLSAHRKTLEMVGARMKTDEAERQLSGLGFSSTKHDQVIVRVKGATTRTLKIVF